MKKIALINGPNLGRLGLREPEIYGSATLADLEAAFSALGAELGVGTECFQSNSEGEIIDKIYALADGGFSGVVMNPGGLTHTSVALRDAVSGSGMAFVEVHISNIHRREEFRHRSLTAPACEAQICGMGFEGYMAALRYLSQKLQGA